VTRDQAGRQVSALVGEARRVAGQDTGHLSDSNGSAARSRAALFSARPTATYCSPGRPLISSMPQARRSNLSVPFGGVKRKALTPRKLTAFC
jgi:hypothetical protein